MLLLFIICFEHVDCDIYNVLYCLYFECKINLSKSIFSSHQSNTNKTYIKTRGSNRPWVADLRKKVKGQLPISGSSNDVVWSFPYIIQCKIVTPGRGQFWPQGHNLNNYGRGPLDDANIYTNMKALGLVVSDKNIFENCILKNLFWPWPTYATNWNGLNNFDRG